MNRITIEAKAFYKEEDSKWVEKSCNDFKGEMNALIDGFKQAWIKCDLEQYWSLLRSGKVHLVRYTEYGYVEDDEDTFNDYCNSCAS